MTYVTGKFQISADIRYSSGTLSILLDCLFLHLLAVFPSGRWPHSLLLLIGFFQARAVGGLVLSWPYGCRFPASLLEASQEKESFSSTRLKDSREAL